MTNLLTEISENKKIILAPDGIVVLDRNYKIIAFNDSAQRITGFSEAQIISQKINFLFPGPEENK